MDGRGILMEKKARKAQMEWRDSLTQGQMGRRKMVRMERVAKDIPMELMGCWGNLLEAWKAFQRAMTVRKAWKGLAKTAKGC